MFQLSFYDYTVEFYKLLLPYQPSVTFYLIHYNICIQRNTLFLCLLAKDAMLNFVGKLLQRALLSWQILR